MTKRARICVNLIYPVGSIYLTVNSANPSIYFGGTWVSWGSGRVPVGIDINDNDFNEVEKTGGEKEHALSIYEMPSHDHEFNRTYDGIANGEDNEERKVLAGKADNRYMPNAGKTSTNGNGVAHNNVQPYITCYMWKRTA